MIRSLLKVLRTRVLRWINRRRMVVAVRSLAEDGRIPVYVIASPPDMHFAPLAVLHSHPRIRHIVVANGVGPAAIAWLRGQLGEVPVVALRASFKRGSINFLPHAEVVRLCQEASVTDFCIQDADCLVTDGAWWQQLRPLAADEFASGPFRKSANKLDNWMPDTFLVMLNLKSYLGREALGIRPDITRTPPPRVSEQLHARGIDGAYFADAYNSYFDTLQVHWVAALLDGGKFVVLPGADEFVYHIGGTTYLTGKNDADPKHWDYWPLNTAFVNLRVLESPRFAGVRSQGAWLFSRYQSSAALLQEFPDFMESQRYQNSVRLLAHFESYLNG